MSATEEWLRYIESRMLHQIYNIKDNKDQENGTQTSERSGTDCEHQDL